MFTNLCACELEPLQVVWLCSPYFEVAARQVVRLLTIMIFSHPACLQAENSQQGLPTWSLYPSFLTQEAGLLIFYYKVKRGSYSFHSASNTPRAIFQLK